jgi:hypothetical protein
VIYATISTCDIRYYLYVWYTILFLRVIYATISTYDIRYYFYVWYTLLFLRMIYATISTYDIRYYSTHDIRYFFHVRRCSVGLFFHFICRTSCLICYLKWYSNIGVQHVFHARWGTFLLTISRRWSRTSLTTPENIGSYWIFSGFRIDHCLSFFFWPLACLFFFNLRLLITPLVDLLIDLIYCV